MNISPVPLDYQTAADAESLNGSNSKAPMDLRQIAIQSLESHPAFRGRLAKCGIHIESDGNTLILNGRVPSWYLKQLLQETLRRVDGVGGGVGMWDEEDGFYYDVLRMVASASSNLNLRVAGVGGR